MIRKPYYKYQFIGLDKCSPNARQDLKLALQNGTTAPVQGSTFKISDVGEEKKSDIPANFNGVGMKVPF